MAKLYGWRDDDVRRILLTFDDGPHLTRTGRLLDILAKHEIKAMFFVVGSRLVSRDVRNLVEQASGDGHIFGNHSFSHTDLTTLSRNEIRRELQKTHDLVVQCAGVCSYFRPPYGARSTDVEEVAKELGYTTMLWTVDTRDYRLKKNAAWVDYGMEQIRERTDSVVLMHDIYNTTIDNVENLIRRIRRMKGNVHFGIF